MSPSSQFGDDTLQSGGSLRDSDREFADLDNEIERYESNVLTAHVPIEASPKVKPIIRRIIASLKNRFADKQNDGIGEDDLVGESPTITCRICENPVPAGDLETHTDWCSRFQDCVLKKVSCSHYLNALLKFPSGNLEEGTIIRDFVTKALDIDEQLGKSAAIKLAKLIYRMAKIDLGKEADGKSLAYFRRIKYLVALHLLGVSSRRLNKKESWRIDLPTCYPGVKKSFIAAIHQSQIRVSMPRQLLKGNRSTSRSPQFGASPPRSSALRNYVHGPVPRINDFDIIKPISRGAYGNVYLAKKRATNDLFAIKALRKSDLIRKNMTSHVLTERRVLSLAQAPFVVMLYYAFESQDHLFLVMEYLIGGDLSSILQGSGTMSEDTACFYIAEVVLALEYLHDHGIIHRDLKPDNMLLDAEGHLKLTDFGLADYESNSSRASPDRVLGTPDYLAPELLDGKEHGTAVDWWAVGVCLFEFLIGVPPFTGSRPEEIFEKIQTFQRIDWAEYSEFGLSDQARDLIDRLLCVDPAIRLGSQGIKSHSFFEKIVWDTLRTVSPPINPQPAHPLDTSQFEPRNRRFADLPEDFLDAEPVGEMESGISTPTRTSSPFDGFMYKNIELLSRVNRRLSSTPASLALHSESRASSGALSDNSFGVS
ncbi:Kinase-like protein [Paramicrosporidium saccamoebae]|uniref:non-specific serine/threonine protein kinase n=1 Tax=Paramicrosporidium saccamoebae TaxID=1246581 RepID=A0A2H9TIG7_9FUNG|nr:Kinase-like protein [Paramicrosporidium saccamoebae]